MLSLFISLLVGLLATLLSSFVGQSLQGRAQGQSIFGTLNLGNIITRGQLISALYNILLFVAMLGGIVANYYWTNGFGSSLELDKFWKPVVISPIIFLSVYVAVAKQARGLVPVLIAFQNGFFWQTILSGAGPHANGQ